MDEFKDILEEKELKDYIKKYKYFILIGVVIIILIITTVVCIKTNKILLNIYIFYYLGIYDWLIYDRFYF